ncbi:MAG: 4Fe-4S dicluster domain-containing protein [Bacteroidales bacterium]
MNSIIERLKQDVRLQEGLHACMNCGICTSVCPATEYFEYAPRNIVIAVQSGNEENLKNLLESDTIWMCGQCMSCKPRCPRNNCPGQIINVLRKLSQETGAFVKSRLGRQQYLIVKSIGSNILQYGYCVHPRSITPENHPEQGPVWKWVYDNMYEVYKRTGANLYNEGARAMRKIADENLSELKSIFNESGGTNLLNTIEKYSMEMAKELGLTDKNGNPDMERYIDFLLNNDEDE